MQTALYQLLLVDDHVVTQIVESELIVRDIGNVAVVHLAALVRFHRLKNAAAAEAEEAVDFTHPLRVTVGKVIVDCDNTYALAFQRVKISRKRTHKCLAFTCLHLGDTALVKNYAAHELNMKVFHAENTAGCLPAHRICFRE